MATENNVKQHKPMNRKRIERVAPSAVDMLDLVRQLGNHGDKIAYKYYVCKEIKSLTYVEVQTMVHECAAAFDSMGLKGQRVAVIGDTSPQWITTYMAAMSAGCVVVPMDKELDVVEICKFLDMVEAKAIIYSKSFNEKFVDAIQNNTTGVQYFIPVTPVHDSSFDAKIISFEDVLAKGRARIAAEGYDYPAVEDHEAMAEMLFTSGTTGTSKCVMLSQKNVFAAVNAACETVCFTKDDVILSVLPVHHTYELMCVQAAMLFGAEICANDSLRHVMKNLQIFKPTGLVLVPLFLNTMYKKIWSEAERTDAGKDLKQRRRG